MEEKHFLILEFLHAQNKPVTRDEFPNSITSHFVYGWQQGSLEHELMIVLRGNKQWIDISHTAPQTYEINDNGRRVLKEEVSRRKNENYVSELRFEKLQSEVIYLQNQVKDFEGSNKRANRALIISLISAAAAIVSAVIAWIAL